MTRRLRRILTLFVLIAALLPMSAAAVPADTTDEPDVTTEAPNVTVDEPDAVGKATLLRLLNADSVAKQERAVRLIGTYAHNGRYEKDFFRVLVTPLHGVVATGETEALRIMAISALSAIGTESAMQGLEAQVDGLAPNRVQKFTRFALAQYEIDQATVKTDRRTQ